MSKTLEKFVNTAAKLGLAGLLTIPSACLGTAIISGYGAQCNQPGAYAFGNALNQTEAAKEGKTTVNVYNGQNKDSPIVYPTSRDNGAIIPKQGPLVTIDKRTGKKWVFTTQRLGANTGEAIEVGENDVLDNEQFIHLDGGGKQVYKKFKGSDNIVEYRFVKYIRKEDSEEKPREESIEKKGSSEESKENKGSGGDF
jgi:hypothetical protein